MVLVVRGSKWNSCTPNQFDAQGDFRLQLGVLTSDFKGPPEVRGYNECPNIADTEDGWEANKDKTTPVIRSGDLIPS